MAPEKTVTVEVLQEHTSDGVLRPLGSKYEINEAVLELLIQRGLVRAAPAAPAPTPPPPRKK